MLYQLLGQLERTLDGQHHCSQRKHSIRPWFLTWFECCTTFPIFHSYFRVMSINPVIDSISSIISPLQNDVFSNNLEGDIQNKHKFSFENYIPTISRSSLRVNCRFESTSSLFFIFSSVVEVNCLPERRSLLIKVHKSHQIVCTTWELVIWRDILRCNTSVTFSMYHNKNFYLFDKIWCTDSYILKIADNNCLLTQKRCSF